MATFVLVHGAGDSAWYWHLVADELVQDGHAVVAAEAPDGESTLTAWAEAVVAGGSTATRPLLVVAQLVVT